MKLKSLSRLSLLLLMSGAAAQEQEPPRAPPPDDQVVPVAEKELDQPAAGDAGSGLPDDAGAGPPADADAPSAGGDADAAGPPAPGNMTDRERLLAEFEHYKRLMDDNVLDEADNVAKRVVELTIRVSGPRSMDTAKALTNLAIVQHRRQQYVAAQQNFETAVDIIEENEDRLNHSLVNPLKGLGAAQLESGRPDLAAETFGRAIHITHVNEGPHNMEQINLLESLAETNLRLGAVDAAKDIHDTIYSLNLREYDSNQMKLVDPLMRRAAWQHRAGYIMDERATYRRIIRIIESKAGKEDLELIEPLTRLGHSYFFEDTSGDEQLQQAPMTSGEIYFKRAVRIAETNPKADWSIEADTKLALGDYYMFQANQSRARRVYREAWDLLSDGDERLAKRTEVLEQIVPLKQNELPRYVGDATRADRFTEDETLLTGTVTVKYGVTDRGHVAELALVEANPPEFVDMERAVVREMRSRLYRPRFVQGDPVDTSDLTFTHTYFYRQSELDEMREAQMNPEPAATDES